MPIKTRPDDYSYGYLIPNKDGLTCSFGIRKPEPKKIIHSGPCTIVFWEDNTKTVVRLEDGKEYDEYAAFTAALAKKVYGSNSQVHKILEKKTKRDLMERIKNAKTVDLFPDIPEEKKKEHREAAVKRKDAFDKIKDAFGGKKC